MRIDWVPFSASALVAGATALSVGALLMPSDAESAETLRILEEQSGRWLAVAGLFFFASVTMTIGLPSILTLFERRGGKLGLVSLGVFSVGCVGLAGYAMLLVFFRALVTAGSIEDQVLTDATNDAGLAVFLYGWIGAFFLGELLLAIALFRAGPPTPRWIPALLVAHIVLLPLGDLLPAGLEEASTLLVTVAFAAIGITANNKHAAIRPALR